MALVEGCEPRTNFDPGTDTAVGIGAGPGERGVSGPDPFMELAFVHDALDDLAGADVAQLDREWFAHYVKALDDLVARVDAIAVDATAHARARGHDRDLGFFTTTSYIKHNARISGPNARGRVQTLRLFDLLPEWANTSRDGEVGIEQTRLMARTVANPRLHDAVIAHGTELLHDAVLLPYDQFERRLRNFARLADPDGARSRSEQLHEARNATMKQRPDGS